LINSCLKKIDHIHIYIQYWGIDGKFGIYVARLRNGGYTSFSESFYPFPGVGRGCKVSWYMNENCSLVID
jgi:hypothetical protein